MFIIYSFNSKVITFQNYKNIIIAFSHFKPNKILNMKLINLMVDNKVTCPITKNIRKFIK